MNIFLGIVGTVVGLMFLTWLWAMIRIKTSKNGRLEITKGSPAYYVGVASFIMPAMFAVFFDSDAGGPLKFRLSNVIKYASRFMAHSTGTKTLCGLFWRTFLLFVIALPGAVLFLPLSIFAVLVVLIIVPPVMFLVDRYDKWSTSRSKETQPSVDNHLEYIRWCYMSKAGFFRSFKKVMTAINNEIHMWEIGPDWRIENNFWELVGTGWITVRVRNQKIVNSNDVDFVKWLKTPDGLAFKKEIVECLKTVRMELANRYFIRNFFLNMKTTACPIIEYETVED